MSGPRVEKLPDGRSRPALNPPYLTVRLVKDKKRIVIMARSLSGNLRRTALALVATAMLASPALAISRVETTGKSCAQVKSIVQSQGAAILRYHSKRSGQILYDRYVRNRHSCVLGEITKRATVPTADAAHCPVLKCYRPDRDRRMKFFRRD
jgi:hypothetical protein